MQSRNMLYELYNFCISLNSRDYRLYAKSFIMRTFERNREYTRNRAQSFLPMCFGRVTRLLLTLLDRHIYLFEERGLRQRHNRPNSSSRYRPCEKALPVGLFLAPRQSHNIRGAKREQKSKSRLLPRRLSTAKIFS